jgi:predicted nucleic acid-binding Zn ribbon protein
VSPPDDHRHCKVCGKLCPPDETTCGPEHAARLDAAVRARRNYVYLLMASGALLLILLVSHYAI